MKNSLVEALINAMNRLLTVRSILSLICGALLVHSAVTRYFDAAQVHDIILIIFTFYFAKKAGDGNE